MIQEEKQLLLKDLCARLSYRIFAQWHHKALNEFRDVKHIDYRGLIEKGLVLKAKEGMYDN